MVVCQAACNLTLPVQFQSSGWLDDQTVIGVQLSGPGFLGYVNLGASTTLTDLGFAGLYVGSLKA